MFFDVGLRLPPQPGPQVGRGGRAGVASPIRCILGGSSATHSTVAAVGTITEQGSLSWCVRDHFPKIHHISMDLQEDWKQNAW